MDRASCRLWAAGGLPSGWDRSWSMMLLTAHILSSCFLLTQAPITKASLALVPTTKPPSFPVIKTVVPSPLKPIKAPARATAKPKPPALPKTTKAPPRPKTTKAPPRPKTTKAPVRPKTTKAPPRPKTTKAPPRPKTTKAPPRPKTTKAPPRPKTTKAPPRPKTTKAPPRPKTTKAPPRPKTTKAPPRPKTTKAPPRPKTTKAPPRPKTTKAPPRPKTTKAPPPPKTTKPPDSTPKDGNATDTGTDDLPKVSITITLKPNHAVLGEDITLIPGGKMDGVVSCTWYREESKHNHPIIEYDPPKSLVDYKDSYSGRETISKDCSLHITKLIPSDSVKYKILKEGPKSIEVGEINLQVTEDKNPSVKATKGLSRGALIGIIVGAIVVSVAIGALATYQRLSSSGSSIPEPRPAVSEHPKSHLESSAKPKARQTHRTVRAHRGRGGAHRGAHRGGHRGGHRGVLRGGHRGGHRTKHA